MSACSFVLCQLLLLTPLGFVEPRSQPRLDKHGFPLPKGAIARLGNLHFAQPEAILALAISPDGKVIATAGHRRVFLWNPNTGRIVRQISTPPGVNKLSFSKNSRLLAVGTVSGNVIIWNVATGKRCWPVHNRAPKSKKGVTALRFIDGDRLLAVANDECRVQLWDVGNGELLRVWGVDKAKKQLLKTYNENYEFTAVGLSPTGKLMAFLARPELFGDEKPYAILVFDTAFGRLLHKIERRGFWPNRIHFLDEGKRFLIQSVGIHFDRGDNVVLTAKSEKERFSFHTRITAELGRPLGLLPITNLLAVSPDCKSFFTEDELGIIHWDIRSGKRLGQWQGRCAGIALLPDRKLAVVARGARLQICDGELRGLSLDKEFCDPPSVRFLSDDRLFADSQHENRFVVWNPIQGKIVQSERRFREP